MDQKKELASRIISDFHSPQEARRAKEEFERVHQQHELPSELVTVMQPLAEFLVSGGKTDVIKLDRLLAKVGLASSVSEAARKLREGAVSVNGQRHTEPFLRIDSGTNNDLLVKMGRRHMRIVLAQ